MISNVGGASALFFANVLSKIFSAIYRLPLSNLLGAEGMGLYQMAFPIYSFLLTFITTGVSITLTRKISSLRANNQENEIYKNYKIARNFTFFLSFIFFFLILFLAYPISYLQGNTKAIFGYFAISVGFIFAGMLGVFRGYYQGFSNMKHTAISQVVEQASKLILGLIFAYFFSKFGTVFGVFGALFGISVSELIAYIYFKIVNRKRVIKQNVKIEKKDYILFFKQVAPVSVSYIMLPLASLIDSFIVINILKGSGFLTSFATSLYGIETGMILPLINMPNVLISAIAICSMPYLCFKYTKGESIKKDISSIFKVVFIFILPCAIGMFLLSDSIISILYPNLSLEFFIIAKNLLKFSVFEMFFICFLGISNSILQSIGKIKFPAISMLCGIVIRFLLSVLFISNQSLNIYGLVIASALGYFVSVFINVVYIKKITGFRLSFLEITVPVFASLVMTGLIIVSFRFFGVNLSLAKTLALVLISVIIYFSVVISLKQFRLRDIKNLGLNSAQK